MLHPHGDLIVGVTIEPKNSRKQAYEDVVAVLCRWAVAIVYVFIRPSKDVIEAPKSRIVANLDRYQGADTDEWNRWYEACEKKKWFDNI